MRPSQVNDDEARALLKQLRLSSQVGLPPARDERYRRYLPQRPNVITMSNQQEFSQAADALTPEAISLSVGISIPSLVPALEGALTRLHTQSPNILLAGALTLATAQEFTAVTEHVFDTPRLTIIDPIPTRAAEWNGKGTFIQGNFLDGSAVPSQSQDIVMSDYLLRNLLNPNLQRYPQELDAAKAFAHAAHRMLKPGGELVMVDHSLAHDFVQQYISNPTMRNIMNAPENIFARSYWERVKQVFHQAGFTNVQISPAVQFDNRQDLTELMLSNNWEILSRGTKIPDGMIITAQRA